MKTLTSTKSRSLRTVLSDLIIYGNLAFTFVFFSAAFNKGCSNSSAAINKTNEIAVSQKNNTTLELTEKGQAKTAAIITSVK
ncbi:MAG: hypothetical protein HYR66_19110 [Sphingobacteriales bacterium]|nr:hypothetical protein [Sphingobacteriales bacterium]MBI3717653.1 hypothetical protein [Sphingobacteriales bacterium]